MSVEERKKISGLQFENDCGTVRFVLVGAGQWPVGYLEESDLF